LITLGSPGRAAARPTCSMQTRRTSGLASHVSFRSSLARPCQMRLPEFQGDIGPPKTPLCGTYGRNPPPVCSLSCDRPEITLAAGRLRRAEADDKWRPSPSTSATIVRPPPDKGWLGACTWRFGHTPSLTIRRRRVAKRSGRWRPRYDIGKCSRRFPLDPVLLDANSERPAFGRRRRAICRGQLRAVRHRGARTRAGIGRLRIARYPGSVGQLAWLLDR